MMTTFGREFLFGLTIALTCLTAAACTGTPTTGGGSPQGTTVSIDVVDSQNNAVNGVAVAQIGTEPWTPVVPETTGHYEIVVPEGETHYGFVVNCPSGLQASSTKVMGHRATVQEATELLVTCPVTFSGATTTIEGVFDATAINADSVTLRTTVDEFNGPGGTPQDVFDPLVATVGQDRALIGAALDSAGSVVAVKAIRNLDLNAATNVSINFTLDDSIMGFTTPDFSASVPAGFVPGIDVSLVLASGERIELDDEPTAGPVLIRTAPKVEPGDVHAVALSASGPAAVQLATIQFRSSLAGLDLNLPQAWSPVPNVVGSALPTYTGLVPLPGQADFRGHLLVHAWGGVPDTATKPNPTTGAIFQVFVTEGWLDGATEVATPDLTNFDGFGGAKPLTGEPLEWYILSFASNLDTQTLLSSPAYPREFNTGILAPYPPSPLDGTTARVALVQGDYTVP